MILIDVNVLINAARHDATDHHRYRTWMDSLLLSQQPFALTDSVASGFIRIMTNHKIYRVPHTVGQAFSIIDDLRLRNFSTWLHPGPQHWTIFSGLCRAVNATGNLIPDAWLAALALEHNCELITTDRDFARFPGLRCRHPLD